MKWYREPLVHFLLIGAALFGIFAIWGGGAPPAAGRYLIVITPGLIQNLQVSFERSQQRPPTAQELQGLIDTYVREEILDREARDRGLDQDDTLIRQQLSQKMLYYLEDSVATPQPTDTQLQAFLEKNAANFRKPDGTLPVLADFRAGVLAAWMDEQRRATAEAAYEKLRTRYTVQVQQPPAASASPVGTAATAASSGTQK